MSVDWGLVSTIRVVTSLPSTGDPSRGEIVMSYSGGVAQLYACTATDTWTQVSGASSFVENEVVTFSGTSGTLSSSAIAGSVKLCRNGIRMIPTTEFSVSGASITLVTSAGSGDTFIADYRK